MGLLRVLKRKGMCVQPFKCGPDYIDGKFHTIAAGRETVNLDTWMASECYVGEVYYHYAKDASVCVVEGVMGLFDGYDRPKIALAKDAAFNFIYKENIDVLSKKADIVTFSPLAGDELPQADYVYLPGGYPEFFVGELSDNIRLGEQLRSFAGNGGRIFAECGGMMYLCRKLVAQDGVSYPMSGVLPLECTLEKMRLHLGYRAADYRGMRLKGHEFHYSSVVEPDVLPSDVCLYNVKGSAVDTPLYRYKNVIAGYTHWYWGENDFFKLWD